MQKRHKLRTLHQHCSLKAVWMLLGQLKAVAVIYSYQCLVLACWKLHLSLVASLAPARGTHGAHQS